MPPRHAYWTIILEGKPTAFRAHSRDELAPTLRQLQARHPDAVMMWFARGRLWESPEAQREAMLKRGRTGDRRGPDWRPGGLHRDPRDRFKVPRDEKRRRFAERVRRDRVDRTGSERGGDRPQAPGRSRDDSRRSGKPQAPASGRPNQDRRPFGSRNRSDSRGFGRPGGDRKPFRPGGRGPGRPGGGRGKPGGGRRGGGGSSR